MIDEQPSSPPTPKPLDDWLGRDDALRERAELRKVLADALGPLPTDHPHMVGALRVRLAEDRNRRMEIIRTADQRGTWFAYWTLATIGTVTTAVSFIQGEPVTFEPSWWTLGLFAALAVVTGVAWWRKAKARVIDAAGDR